MCTALTSRPANATKVRQPARCSTVRRPAGPGPTGRVVDLGRLAVDQPGEHEEDEEQGRHDRAQRQADVADPGARLHSPADDPRGEPEHDEHDGAHVGAVRRQIGSTERRCQRRRAERQQRRIQRDAVHEHEPSRLEPGPVAEGILDPHEDPTTVRRRELRRHEATGSRNSSAGRRYTVTAPSPKLAESESWAMLPTLATMSIASAGQATMATALMPPWGGRLGVAASPSLLMIVPLERVEVGTTRRSGRDWGQYVRPRAAVGDRLVGDRLTSTQAKAEQDVLRRRRQLPSNASQTAGASVPYSARPCPR